jgi:hypothetical protein
VRILVLLIRLNPQEELEHVLTIGVSRWNDIRRVLAHAS